ncbi:MAG: hypothetical protein H6734_14770 [Alphaproteobacteria bacterium]|nr:hypothetical protein [Alphaproteobacteria bacterium]
MRATAIAATLTAATGGLLGLVGLLGWVAHPARGDVDLDGLPGETLDLRALTADRAELLDPAAALPRTHLHDRDALAALLDREQTCGPPVPVPPSLARLAAWVDLRCAGDLPDTAWLLAGDTMHPMGRSWAALAAEAGLDPATVAPHLHATERAGTLGTLGEHALAALLDASPAIDAGSHVLVRHPGPWRILPTYTAVPTAVADRALASRGLRRADCPEPLCVEPLPRPSWPVAAMTVGWAALGLALLGLAVRWRAERSREASRRAFVLTTLTHELRTPVTAMDLAIEALRDEVDALSEPGRHALGRLLDQQSRLRRTLASTAAYVGLLERAPRIEPLDDVGAWLAARLDLEVEHTGDRRFATDPDWLALAVDNLVANAFVHGAEPVRVTSRITGDRLVVAVSDAGSLPGDVDLDGLTAPFQRGGSSDGLGLGLALVSRVARALGGGLEVRRDPTTFILTVRSAR